MINHHDDVSLRRIINVPRRNIGDTTIDEIQALATQKNVSMGEILHNIYNYQSSLKPEVVEVEEVEGEVEEEEEEEEEDFKISQYERTT